MPVCNRSYSLEVLNGTTGSALPGNNADGCCRAGPLSCNPADCLYPDRHHFNAIVSPQELRDTYTVAFEAAVRAGAAGMMCAYNAVNGEPSCTDKGLLNDMLRGEFGFDGIVATDCTALSDAQHHHRRYNTEVEVVTAAVHAGCDSNCGPDYTQGLPDAIGNKTLSLSDLENATRRLLHHRFRLGLFEPDHPAVPRATLAAVDSVAHRALALKAAAQGLVLLQNRPAGAMGKPLLPLKPKGTVAVVGPNANATKNLQVAVGETVIVLTPPFHPH